MTDSVETLEAPDMTNNAHQRRGSFTHRLYTGQFEFSFVPRRKIWYTISIVLVVISLAALLLRGLNLGIDFKGGSEFTVPVSTANSQSVDTVRNAMEHSGVNDLSGASVATVGATSVQVQTRSLDTAEVTTMRNALAQSVNTTETNVAYSLIGPSWGGQITDKAIQALVVFLILVVLMIWVFFREWRMAVSALVALLHDLMITVGLYALIGFSVTPSTVIGVLTILGYSLYDTVVVFDKVRENTIDITKQKRTFSVAANQAVNQVLVRSINTTLIGILPVVALLIAGVGFLGGDGPLADLGLALLIGMVTGAYSSIFIATPLLTQLRERQPDMVKHREDLVKAQKKSERDEQRTAESGEPAHRKGKIVAAQVNNGARLAGERREVAEGRRQPVRNRRSERKKK